jgi:hemerythrin-like domain-containing protein
MSSDAIDLTMMTVSHDGLRRDAGHLQRAVERRDAEDPERRRAVLDGWSMFRLQLGHHHTNEDKSLWPRMRAGLRERPDDLVVLDAMEAEHERLDPLLAAVDRALADPEAGQDTFAQAVAEFDAALTAHLAHEERDALPLVEAAVAPAEWRAITREMRDLIGLKGAADFFPWLLDDAPDRDKVAVLRQMPAPARLMYHRMWAPRYARTRRWE